MKIWSLQVLRFWAALGVVVYHASIAVNHATHRFGVLGLGAALVGRMGVDVFFVLSGVIIALTSRGLSAQDFVAKRARRILPLYGALTLVYLAGEALKSGLGWREAVASLTLWPALDRMTGPAVPVGWTLCFEALFYASAALVLWRSRLIWGVLAAFATALALRTAPGAGPAVHYLGNPIALEFLMGVGLTRLPPWRGAVWLVPLGLAAAWVLGPSGYSPNLEVSDFLAGTQAWRRVLFLGLPAAVVVWGALQMRARQGALTTLGDASYAIYLFHLPVVTCVVWAACRFTPLPPDVIVALAAGAGVLLGWRIHELFEKPLLGWLRSAPRLPRFRAPA
jgi:exopolysaccharide production protein ExoZ